MKLFIFRNELCASWNSKVNLGMGKMNSPFFLFHAAKEFFENGTTYASKYFKRNTDGTLKPFDSLTHPKLCVPATNISFSLELILKGFLMQAGKRKNGHNLSDLYNCLDEDLKRRIVEHYKMHDTFKNYINVHVNEESGNSHGQIERIYQSSKNEEEILLMLDKHKLSFINFRYLHEFQKSQDSFFYFKEFSNLTFSALVILGETLNLKVVTVPPKTLGN